ncbi:MAG: hypothetical protein FJ308_23025, partial [Planctomycetes bacterium]|nr:hypothetical protein [Planctomycetota bacterium]
MSVAPVRFSWRPGLILAEDDLDGSESKRLPSPRTREAAIKNGIRIMGHSLDNHEGHRFDGDHLPGSPTHSASKRDHLDLGREIAWTRASARAEMGLAHTESWIGVSVTFSGADPDSHQQ